MATVRINRAQAKVTSIEAGLKLVTQVMHEVEFQAKLKVNGPYSTGTLSLSIHGEGPIVTGDRINGRVGTDLPYAASVHDGAEIHSIFPKGAPAGFRFGSRRRPQLKFYWRKAGRVVFFPHIPGSPSTIGRSHPGQKGKKFLTEPLRDAARRHGMRVITFDV